MHNKGFQKEEKEKGDWKQQKLRQREDSKGSKRKTKLITREPPIRLTDDFSTEAIAGQKGVAKYIQSSKGEKSAT